ncbi:MULTISPECIES: phosphatase PAP2 family protein [unclassified Streptomyces]|uniref:phosphatase PAP2 family protein n=1 Tax=unclassified Streptomyces TaxID=2593676 RepID=UPI00225B2831|nr:MULTISPECIES: phosphatase PAP2 family protein [unclassified Streptomyces]MCX4528420.1 phosphatase PAP2 family protein [Streptomyces sp. NBC_01551]MCX4540981.1 phosphatase PAP2 family protein [Streptomyces sp. NBC_01565]
MSETARSRETGDDPGTGLPQRRTGHAFAHAPHRSDGRPPQTPRGARQPDPGGRPGTIPPVPGRPATLLLFSLLGLALTTWQVLVTGPLLTPDEHLSRALVRTVPDAVTERLADLGNIPVALPVLALAMAYSVRRSRAWAPALTAGLAMALVPALIIPLKEWTARPGPLEPWAAGYYPSGHTATAAVAYLGAALLIAPYTRRPWPMAAALTLTAATAAGLIVRGFHWPLDVLASCFLCLPLLLAVARSVRRGAGPPGRSGAARGPGPEDGQPPK